MLSMTPSSVKTAIAVHYKGSTWAFCLRMREMNGMFRVRRHLLFLNALRRVFKRVIYVVTKILPGEMKDYNKFTHISNTVDIHSV